MSPSEPITGTHIQYYLVCPRKCWLSLHRLEQEADDDLVLLGRLTHESSFARQQMREVDIDGFLRVDFTQDGIVHEVKHGQEMAQAHRMQLAYYLPEQFVQEAYAMRQAGEGWKMVELLLPVPIYWLRRFPEMFTPSTDLGVYIAHSEYNKSVGLLPQLPSGEVWMG